MASLETTDSNDNYETRELAWEIQQPHPDQQRIKFFLEDGACLRSALRMANMAERELMKRPQLRTLVQRHLNDHKEGVPH